MREWKQILEAIDLPSQLHSLILRCPTTARPSDMSTLRVHYVTSSVAYLRKRVWAWDDGPVGAAARSVENAAGVSLGDLIDFCARCAVLGIPESTKLRAITDDHTALLAVFAETQVATPLEIVNRANAEGGVNIEGGVIIEIPDEE